MPARSSSDLPPKPPPGAHAPAGGSANRLQIVTAGAATLALVVSSLALLRTLPTTGAAAAPSSSARDEAALRRDLDALQKRVDSRGGADPATTEALKRLARRVAALESERDPDAGEPAEAEAEAESEPAPGAAPEVPAHTPGTPLYSKLVVAQKALSVRDTGDGSLSVTNTDPALTGQRVTISATRMDGTVEEVHLTIPPPENP